MTSPPDRQRHHGEHRIPESAAVVVVSLLLAWMAWSLTRGEWILRGADDTGRLANDILSFERALRLAIAGFFMVATYLALKTTVTKLQESAVPRLSLTFWHHRQFVILSPLVFLFAYVSVLIQISFFGVVVGDRPVIPGLFDFWLFWHETGTAGLSLMTSILWLNVLVAVYLWLSFRSYRSSIRQAGVVLYLPYVAALLFLVAVHDHYYKVAQASPKSSVLIYPLGVPDPTPDERGSRPHARTWDQNPRKALRP